MDLDLCRKLVFVDLHYGRMPYSESLLMWYENVGSCVDSFQDHDIVHNHYIYVDKSSK
jgi:hypothetical protein